MADREVNYRITLDDSGLKKLEDRLTSIHTKMREMDAAWKSMGAGPGGGGGRGGSVATGGVSGGGPSRAGGGGDPGFRMLDQRLGYTNRLLERLVGSIERALGRAGAERPGSQGFQGNTPGNGFTRTFDKFAGSLMNGTDNASGINPNDRKRIGTFISGSQLSQLGHAVGGTEGVALSGVGGIVQGAASGGLPGAAIAGVKALYEFSQALDKEAKASAERVRANEAFARGNAVTNREQLGRNTELRTRLEGLGRGREQYDIEHDVMGQKIDQTAAIRKTLIESRNELGHQRNQAIRDGDPTKRDQLAQQQAQAQQAINANLEEENRLRGELLKLEHDQAAAVEKLAAASVNGLNKQKSALYELLDAEKQRYKDGMADFGRMSEFDQERMKRVAGEFDAKRGAEMSESDKDFARSNPLFEKDVREMDSAEGKVDGYEDDAGIQRRAREKQSQIEGQIKTLEVNIKTAATMEVEAFIDKSAVADALKDFKFTKEELVEAVQKGIEAAQQKAASKPQQPQPASQPLTQSQIFGGTGQAGAAITRQAAG